MLIGPVHELRDFSHFVGNIKDRVSCNQAQMMCGVKMSYETGIVTLMLLTDKG